MFWILFYFDTRYLLSLVKMVNNALLWLVSINKDISLKKASFESNRVAFIFLPAFPLKLALNFNYSENIFALGNMDMIWCILWRKGVIFITFPQSFWIYVLNVIFMWYYKFHFSTDIPFIMPKKKDKFYIYILWIANSYNLF